MENLYDFFIDHGFQEEFDLFTKNLTREIYHVRAIKKYGFNPKPGDLGMIPDEWLSFHIKAQIFTILDSSISQGRYRTLCGEYLVRLFPSSFTSVTKFLNICKESVKDKYTTESFIKENRAFLFYEYLLLGKKLTKTNVNDLEEIKRFFHHNEKFIKEYKNENLKLEYFRDTELFPKEIKEKIVKHYLENCIKEKKQKLINTDCLRIKKN